MTSALPLIGKIAELLGGDGDDQSDFLATDRHGSFSVVLTEVLR